jgi:protein translocase SecG subunit
MIQQGKSSMGLGNLGGSAQILFGGSGGQDILQKITWVMGTIYLVGSLMLVLMGSKQSPLSYIRVKKPSIQRMVPVTDQRTLPMEEVSAPVPADEKSMEEAEKEAA